MMMMMISNTMSDIHGPIKRSFILRNNAPHPSKAHLHSFPWIIDLTSIFCKVRDCHRLQINGHEGTNGGASGHKHEWAVASYVAESRSFPGCLTHRCAAGASGPVNFIIRRVLYSARIGDRPTHPRHEWALGQGLNRTLANVKELQQWSLDMHNRVIGDESMGHYH